MCPQLLYPVLCRDSNTHIRCPASDAVLLASQNAQQTHRYTCNEVKSAAIDNEGDVALARPADDAGQAGKGLCGGSCCVCGGGEGADRSVDSCSGGSLETTLQQHVRTYGRPNTHGVPQMCMLLLASDASPALPLQQDPAR